MKKIFIIGEIGINHNGNLEIAKKIIEACKAAGADAVKFQKRTIDLVYTQEDLKSLRESPWGNTFEQQKRGLELTENDYDEINKYAKNLNIYWFASSWDIQSQIFLRKYDLKFNKVASAMLTNYELLNMIAEEKKHTFVSTGMHTLDEIEKAVSIFKKNNVHLS